MIQQEAQPIQSFQSEEYIEDLGYVTVNDPKIQVCIHKEPWLTKKGFRCSKHVQFVLFVGLDPIGPRGGTGGRVVDAVRHDQIFRRRE